MLKAICYDISRPRSHADLKRGVFACRGENHNFAYAPWMVDTRKSPTAMLSELTDKLGRKSDKLMVLNLGSAAGCAMANPKTSDRSWLGRHGAKFNGGNSSGVVGVAYTLHGAYRDDYGRLQRLIKRSFPDYFKPVHALYFVATEKSPRAVRDIVKKFLPNRERRRGRPDELLVLEIPTRTSGKTQRSGGGKWFRDHGIKRVH